MQRTFALPARVARNYSTLVRIRPVAALAAAASAPPAAAAGRQVRHTACYHDLTPRASFSSSSLFNTDEHESGATAARDAEAGIKPSDRGRVFRVASGALQGMVSVQVSNPREGDVFELISSTGQRHLGVTVHKWADIAWLLVDTFVQSTYTGGLGGHEQGAVDLGITLQPGDRATRLSNPSAEEARLFQIPTGPALAGRVVDFMGRPLDAKGPIAEEGTLWRGRNLDQPDVEARTPIRTPLLTGIKSIDTLVPIGRGQAMLVYGERGIGKSSLAIDTILHQHELRKADKGAGVQCVYVITEGGAAKAESLVSELERHGAMENTTIVLGDAGMPPALMAPARHLAPDTGAGMAEYYRDHQQHSLCVYDELEAHGRSYWEMCQVLDDSTNRLAKHVLDRSLYSNLIQRSANLNGDLGGGSLSSLVLLRTGADAAEPYEMMSVSDGQIALSEEVRQQGYDRPMDIGASLSRIGSKGRSKAINSVATTLRADLLQWADEAGAHKTSNPRVQRVVQFLCNQPPRVFYPPEEQAVGAHVALAYHELLARVGIPENDTNLFISAYLDHLKSDHPTVLESIRAENDVSVATQAGIRLSLPMFASLTWPQIRDNLKQK